MVTGLGEANEAKSDVKFTHGQKIQVGETVELEVRATPGHTEGCVSYVSKFLSLSFNFLIGKKIKTVFRSRRQASLYWRRSIHSWLWSN